MKKVSFALMLIAIQSLFLLVWAGDIKEADYPNQYEVVGTIQGDRMVIEKVCSMTLRDQAKPSLDINVSRNGYGACHVLETGKVYRGRQNQKKNKIELVIPVGEDKARVEEWQIVGTVASSPK